MKFHFIFALQLFILPGPLSGIAVHAGN